MAVGAQNTQRADDDSAGPHPPQNGLRAQDAPGKSGREAGVPARDPTDANALVQGGGFWHAQSPASRTGRLRSHDDDHGCQAMTFVATVLGTD